MVASLISVATGSVLKATSRCRTQVKSAKAALQSTQSPQVSFDELPLGSAKLAIDVG
ncbi:MAG: hypothetical protein O3A47_04985 [Chloroflexi bacterium]|nr:hypothetical protein [Chloroflexota bacterium]